MAKLPAKTTERSIVLPEQLRLFQALVDGDSSNAVELYDLLPKYKFGKGWLIPDTELPADKHVIEREFTNPVRLEGKLTQQTSYVKISPAVIFRDGEDGKPVRYYAYPSYREQLVEDAIRKVALDSTASLRDGQVWAYFTVRQIRRILAESGHTMRHDEVLEALTVLNRCTMEWGFKSANGKSKVAGHSPLFPELVLKTADDIASGDDVYSAVKFHELVNASIRNQTFRNYDFATCIQYRLQLANFLHKRLSQRFIQAHRDSTYRISLQEFASSCGIKDLGPDKELVRKMKEALAEMQKANVVASYETESKPDPVDRRKRLDTIFIISVTDDFIQKTIRVNAHKKRLAAVNDDNDE